MAAHRGQSSQDFRMKFFYDSYRESVFCIMYMWSECGGSIHDFCDLSVKSCHRERRCNMVAPIRCQVLPKFTIAMQFNGLVSEVPRSVGDQSGFSVPQVHAFCADCRGDQRNAVSQRMQVLGFYA